MGPILESHDTNLHEINFLFTLVKGKNMVRTRSSGAAEELKPVTKKRISGKENKTASSGLRSGLKRIQPVITKSSKKIIKPKHLRTGLRSSGLNVKATEKSLSNIKVAVINMKKSDRETKRNQIEVPQIKTKNLKLKKTEGFSDFSSDDNEPLLAVKKPKITAKKSAKIPLSVRKEEKKTFVKTRSQANESDLTRTSARPTRKTKEAAAIYMEMITKKLVSPDKSGDDDVSSVDSFPELPNAKQNGESRIKVINY